MGARLLLPGTASAVVGGGTACDDDMAVPSGTMDRAAAEEKLDALFGNGSSGALASNAWKERLETISRIAEQVQSLLAASSLRAWLRQSDFDQYGCKSINLCANNQSTNRPTILQITQTWQQ